MARSYAGLANMAARFGFRRARDHSTSACQCDTCLRTRGVLPFRSLEDVERKLSAMAQERARRRATILHEDHPDGS